MTRRAVVLDSSDESSDDGSASSQQQEALIDDEAVESTYDIPKATDFEDTTPEHSFSLFTRLPPELRRRVWEIFCPDLAQKGRVIPLEFARTGIDKFRRRDIVSFSDHLSLADQTEAVRVLASVHGESRQMALDAFPDTLPVIAEDEHAEIRIHRDRDIILFNPGLWTDDSHESRPVLREDIRDIIRHIGFTYPEGEFINQESIDTLFGLAILEIMRNFESLQTVFIAKPHRIPPVINRRWAVSPMSRQYRLQTFEKQAGLGEDLEWIYCWPDMANHPDFSSHHVIQPFYRLVPSNIQQYVEKHGIRLAPMLVFEYDDLETFDRLFLEHEQGTGVDDEDAMSLSGSDTDSHPSQNEYESEGIDDSEIVEEDESSEDELIPRPISLDGSSDAGDPDESNSPPGDVTAQFSSPEPEDQDHDRHKRKRRRVIDDSDDGTEEEGPVSKMARVDNAVTISSDDAGGDDEDVRPGRSRRRPQVISSDQENEPSSPSEEESEDDDHVPARPSLAERLRQFRDENPVSSASEEGSDELDGDEDDDEDEDEEEDDEDRMGGFIDDEAEDSGDSDEEAEEYESE